MRPVQVSCGSEHPPERKTLSECIGVYNSQYSLLDTVIGRLGGMGAPIQACILPKGTNKPVGCSYSICLIKLALSWLRTCSLPSAPLIVGKQELRCTPPARLTVDHHCLSVISPLVGRCRSWPCGALRPLEACSTGPGCLTCIC